MQMHTSDTDFSEESRDTLLGMLDEMIADSDQGNSWITDSERLRTTQQAEHKHCEHKHCEHKRAETQTYDVSYLRRHETNS